jgi:hypothetical protein
MREVFRQLSTWFRRPQFSVRTFLIAVTLICGPMSYIGAIKYKAYSYRAAMSDLQSSSIDVRRIRTDSAAGFWQQFIENWIDNDAYAGDAVEVSVRGLDLRASDVRRLNSFAEIRSIEFASPKLTDVTLRELPNLKQPSSLTIREGSFTRDGLISISECNRLEALDLTGLALTDDCLEVVAPSLAVDDLALSIYECSGASLEKALEGKKFKRLALTHEAPPNVAARLQTVTTVRAFPCDFEIPSCDSLYLKNFSLSDEVLRSFSERKTLKSLTLRNGSFDAGLAVQIFAMPGQAPQDRPMLHMGEVVEARSEVGPEEILLLQKQSLIENLTIQKLRRPSESIDILLKNRRLKALYVPNDVPVVDLIRLAKSIDLMSTGFASSRNEVASRGANGRQIPEIIYRHHSLHEVLEQNGVDVRALIREKAEAEKHRSIR